MPLTPFAKRHAKPLEHLDRALVRGIRGRQYAVDAAVLKSVPQHRPRRFLAEAAAPEAWLHAEEELHFLAAFEHPVAAETNKCAIVRIGSEINVHGKEAGFMLGKTAFAGSNHILDLLDRDDLPFKQISAHLRIDAELMHYRNMVFFQRYEPETFGMKLNHAGSLPKGVNISEHLEFAEKRSRERRMRFSFWPNPTQPFSDLLELVQHADSTGWDGVWYADHFMPNAEDTSTPWAEAWTTLSALGALTKRVRLGTLVTGNTYRHPAVLAKMAATLDHITEGRVVLGLGSGWQENEHRQYGLPFYDVPERLARLDEACEVIKRLFHDQRSHFEGRFYTLTDATLEPKPLQHPLPLMIGGGGEKVTLKITAKHADEWNVWGDPTILRQKMAILDAHCADVDRNPADIQRSAVALLFMSEDNAFLEQMLNSDIQQPHLVGTPAEIHEIIEEYEEAGVNEFILPDFTLGSKEQKLKTMDTFLKEVAGR